MRSSTATPGSRTKAATPPPGFRFELVPLERLLAHEELEPDKPDRVVDDIRRRRIVEEPLLVASGDFVVLNGHHRLAALRTLHARRAPCWLVDYERTDVHLQPWPSSQVTPLPTKSEVVRRAREGRLYPPKTTYHTLSRPLPPRATPLEDLL